MNNVLRKLLFSASILILIFLIISKTTDIYQFALAGAVYEILWLPVLIMVFAIPVAAAVGLVKDKYGLSSLNLYTLLLCVINILLLVFL